MNDFGFIKLHRSISKWGWWEDDATFRVFVGLILLANYKDGEFRGKTIRRGSFVTSIEKLCQFFDMGESKLRRSLKALCNTGEVKDKPTNKYRVITVVNYDKYQSAEESLIPSKPRNKPKNKPRNNPKNNPHPIKERKKSLSPHRETETAHTPARLGDGGRLAPEQQQAGQQQSEQKSGGLMISQQEMLAFAVTFPGSLTYQARLFQSAFQTSGTCFPPDWQDLYRQHIASDREEQMAFIKKLEAGEFREKWGTAPPAAAN